MEQSREVFPMSVLQKFDERATPDHRAMTGDYAMCCSHSAHGRPHHSLPAPLCSPTVKIEHYQGNMILTLTWVYKPPSDCHNDIKYIVEMEKDGNFEKLMEVDKMELQLQHMTRGKLYQFRYRVCDGAAESEPSPPGSAFIGYPDEPDPPLDISVQSMEKYRKSYVPTTQEIGIGAFANVMLVKDRSGQMYASKQIYQRKLKNSKHEQDEFNIMRRLNHDRVVSLIGAYADDKSMFIVTEYLSGGELFDRIVEDKALSERECSLFVRQLCEGAAYLHHQRVAHLDLKPENVVCTSLDSNRIKIIDFGLAKILEPNAKKVCTMYGTKDYVAPEVLKFKPISFKTDIWSIGVITYVLLSGLFPFAGESWPERGVNIERCRYNFEEEVFAGVSSEAKQFISRLLVGEPRRRPTAAECLQHPWLRPSPTPTHSANTRPMDQTRHNLILYLSKYRAKWQKARNVLRAASRLRTGGEAIKMEEERRATAQRPARQLRAGMLRDIRAAGENLEAMRMETRRIRSEPEIGATDSIYTVENDNSNSSSAPADNGSNCADVGEGSSLGQNSWDVSCSYSHGC